jgi:hypothetical protein
MWRDRETLALWRGGVVVDSREFVVDSLGIDKNGSSRGRRSSMNWHGPSSLTLWRRNWFKRSLSVVVVSIEVFFNQFKFGVVA